MLQPIEKILTNVISSKILYQSLIGIVKNRRIQEIKKQQPNLNLFDDTFSSANQDITAPPVILLIKLQVFLYNETFE